MVTQKPFISIVICTRNRASQLIGALNTFKRLIYSGLWELVIVDNGSRDDSYNIARQFACDSGLTVHVIKEDRVGLACARNAGILATQGDIIAFTDDDCYPEQNYLQKIADTFSDGAIDYAGGRVMLYDNTDRRVTIQELNKLVDIEGDSFVPSGLIHGANMAFRRDSLLKIGGFDERLGAGTRFKSGEDTDVLRRLSFAGFAGRYVPDICVFHHHGRKTEQEEIRLRNGYDRGVAAVLIKGIANPRTRRVCLKQWYWLMRGYPLSKIARQIFYGLLFLLSAGPQFEKIIKHPSPLTHE